MSSDPSDKEREFIAEIEAETGRDLAAWMRAIDAEASGDRNATIDWLKAQHVFFRRASRAMWLERIHHNGGRPIFDGAIGMPALADGKPRQTRAARTEPAALAPPPAREAIEQPMANAAPVAEFDAVLARGKAYRPLAAMLLAEIRKALPETVVGVGGDLIILGHPAAFAAIEPRPKDVRLGLALADGGQGWERSKIAGAPASITHMRALTDARTVDAALIDLVRRAAVAMP